MRRMFLLLVLVLVFCSVAGGSVVASSCVFSCVRATLLDDNADAVSIRERVLVHMYDGNGYGCCCCCYCRRVFVIILNVRTFESQCLETRQNYRRRTVNPEDV